MPYSVGGAFTQFRSGVVDLDAEVTKTARASRDYLVDQIKTLAKNNSGFPRFGGSYRAFGSFARRTKIRPLDDIDLLLVLDGSGTAEASTGTSDPYIARLKITTSTAPLAAFSEAAGYFDTARYVNSTKVLNAIKSHLTGVPNYSKATIKRTGQAVTLNLVSRDWVFDIVPALAVANAKGETTHYLIPDGNGKWIRTDPRVDETNVTNANTRHAGKLLPTMRLLKYWNRRTTKPRLPSYYFETLVLKTFASASAITDVPTAVKHFFDYGSTHLWLSCPDPKGLGPALDASIDSETKRKVADALKQAATDAGYAVMYDRQSNPEKAIYWWRQVFGSEFPTYGL